MKKLGHSSDFIKIAILGFVFSINLCALAGVSRIVEDCYQETIKLLKKYKSKLTKLAELLLEKEVIFKEDLLAIFGPRPWDKEEIKEVKPKSKKIKAKSKKHEPKQVDNAGPDK